MKCPTLFQQHDTTIFKEHDSIVYFHDTFTTPAQTHTDTFNIPCPDHVAETKHFKGGSATVQVSKGQIIVQCHEDSLKQVILHKDSLLIAQATIIKQGLATKTITVKESATSFESFCKWFTWLILIGIVAVAGVKYLPDIIKSFKP